MHMNWYIRLAAITALVLAMVVPVVIWHSEGMNIVSAQTSVPPAVSIESYNYPGYYVRHSNFKIVLEQFENTTLFKEDATFLPVPGLGNNQCISIKSYNFPEYYVRHENFELVLDEFEDTALFKEDATFCPAPGLADMTGWSLSSHNYPDHYVRHTDFAFVLDEVEDSTLFREDATVYIHNALAEGLTAYLPLVRSP